MHTTDKYRLPSPLTVVRILRLPLSCIASGEHRQPPSRNMLRHNFSEDSMKWKNFAAVRIDPTTTVQSLHDSEATREAQSLSPQTYLVLLDRVRTFRPRSL